MIDAATWARAWAYLTQAHPIAPADPVDASPPAAPSEPSAQDMAVQVAAILCRKFEGLYLHPYLCPAGVPTIGYGATYYEDGLRVTLKDAPITPERAESLLQWHLRTVYLPAVQQLCPSVSEPHRLAALVDFSFNLGATRLKTSTLRLRVNADRWADVPAELRKWVMASGKKLRGLVNRREAEIAVLPGS